MTEYEDVAFIPSVIYEKAPCGAFFVLTEFTAY